MLLLVGTGGHAKVVFEALISSAVDAANIYPRDEDAKKHDQLFMGSRILTPEFPVNMDGMYFHIAIGDNEVRAKLSKRALDGGAKAKTIIHSSADVSATANIKGGVFCASGSIVAVDATVGYGTIVNHNAVVDHDCNIGEFCHIAPNAILGGNVTVGDRVLIGAGAVVLPDLSIGSDVIIGAGSVVTKPVESHQVWVGNSLNK